MICILGDPMSLRHPVGLRHVTHMIDEWVMSHIYMMNESCHTYKWWWRVTTAHEWVTNDMNEQWGMLQIRMMARRNESCHTYKWWWRVTTAPYESCHAYGWVVPHIWMRQVARMHELCHRNEWFMSRMIWMSHESHEWVTNAMNESRMIWMSHELCHRNEWFMSRKEESYHTYESCMSDT